MAGAEATVVDRAIQSWLMPVVSVVPIPHRVALGFLLRDNEAEIQRDGWGRLWDPEEAARYAVVRDLIGRFAGEDGAILDVGCAQGILQTELRYGTYTGVDVAPETIAHAAERADDRTRFLVADASAYVPDRPYDAIVFNECLYYLRDPVAVARRYVEHLAPDGVLVISMFDRAWALRRLLRRLGTIAPEGAGARVMNREGAAWTVRVLQPGGRA